MNPELLRNIWLEWTPVKRVAAPIAILMIAIIANALPHDGLSLNYPALQGVGLAVFGLFALWGTARAADGITSEIVAGTWDWQRLAPHKPVDLLVGKLFGAPVFEWYGASFGLIMFVIGQLNVRPPLFVLQNVVTMLVGTLLLHAIALLFSFAVAGKLRGVRRAGRLGGRQGAVAAIIIFVFNIGPLAGFLWAGAEYKPDAATVGWWVPLPPRDFVLVTLIMLLAWAIVGLYRMIRAELQEPVTPWPWIGFLLFCAAYFHPLTYGLLKEGGVSQLTVFCGLGAVIFGAWFWPLLLAERKDMLWLRTLDAARKRGDTATVLTLTPLWLVTLIGYMAFVGLTGATLAGGGPKDAGQVVVGGLVLALFMLRDVGIVIGVHLSDAPRRPDLMVIFLGVVLYALIPGMLALFGDAGIIGLYFFVPLGAYMHAAQTSGPLNMPFSLMCALPGLVVAWLFAAPKIRRALGGTPVVGGGS